MSEQCLICAKHRGEGPLVGPLVWHTPLFRVYHVRPDDSGTAPLGRLFIETKRHAPYLADLTDDEASALGTLRSRLARALRAELRADVIFTMVIGLHVPHFHEHVLPRYPDSPDDLPWDRSDEAAPRGGEQEIADLAGRMAPFLQD